MASLLSFELGRLRAGTILYCTASVSVFISTPYSCCPVLPCLALPCLALPCLALPCVALRYLAYS